MRKESIGDTIDHMLLETDVELYRATLNFCEKLRSRQGAAGIGVLTGLAVVCGEWKAAVGLSALSIFYKKIGEGRDSFEERLEQALKNKREELKNRP
jgi:hypothetical protein